MAKLTTSQVEDAAELSLSATKLRFPDHSRDARDFLESAAASWDTAQVWEGPCAMVVLTHKAGARWGAPEAQLHVLTNGARSV